MSAIMNAMQELNVFIAEKNIKVSRCTEHNRFVGK